MKTKSFNEEMYYKKGATFSCVYFFLKYIKSLFYYGYFCFEGEIVMCSGEWVRSAEIFLCRLWYVVFCLAYIVTAEDRCISFDGFCNEALLRIIPDSIRIINTESLWEKTLVNKTQFCFSAATETANSTSLINPVDISIKNHTTNQYSIQGKKYNGLGGTSASGVLIIGTLEGTKKYLRLPGAPPVTRPKRSGSPNHALRKASSLQTTPNYTLIAYSQGFKNDTMKEVDLSVVSYIAFDFIPGCDANAFWHCWQCEDTSKLSTWALGTRQISYFTNDRPYEWYIDQLKTGPFGTENCGPSTAIMAALWTNKNFPESVEDARRQYRPEGGWWYTIDITSYFDQQNIAYDLLRYTDSSQITDILTNGNIIIT